VPITFKTPLVRQAKFVIYLISNSRRYLTRIIFLGSLNRIFFCPIGFFSWKRYEIVLFLWMEDPIVSGIPRNTKIMHYQCADHLQDALYWDWMTCGVGTVVILPLVTAIVLTAYSNSRLQRISSTYRHSYGGINCIRFNVLEARLC